MSDKITLNKEQLSVLADSLGIVLKSSELYTTGEHKEIFAKNSEITPLRSALYEGFDDIKELIEGKKDEDTVVLLERNIKFITGLDKQIKLFGENIREAMDGKITVYPQERAAQEKLINAVIVVATQAARDIEDQQFSEEAKQRAAEGMSMIDEVVAAKEKSPPVGKDVKEADHPKDGQINKGEGPNV